MNVNMSLTRNGEKLWRPQTSLQPSLETMSTSISTATSQLPPPSPPSLQRLICQHTPHLAPMFGARSQRVASSPLAPLYADESAAETNFASLNMKKKRKKSM